MGITATSSQRGKYDSNDNDVENSNESSNSIDDYNLGISGVSFGTGPLSKRMYDAIMSQNNFGGGIASDEIRRALTVYAMDFTAKEATRAALKQNGLDMTLTNDQEDVGMWGQVDTIRLLDPNTNRTLPQIYDSVDDAVEDWIPGQGFDFVVRQVPAKLRQLDLSELLQALDPDGSLRKSAKDANLKLPDDDDDDLLDIRSLQDLANENVRRSEQTPRFVETKVPYTGKLEQRGYRVINRSDLLQDSVNADGTENQKTLMHVMDALVSHGCLVVDVSDGGTSYQRVLTMANMWKTVEEFFSTVQNDTVVAAALPPMSSVLDSPYAKVGYATYDNGSMQFLETRWERKSGRSMFPVEAAAILGESGTNHLRMAFDLVTDIGKDVVRIATAASTIEHDGFAGFNIDDDDDDDGPSISGLSSLNERNNDNPTRLKRLASEAGALLANELVDDGKQLSCNNMVLSQEGAVSMSPHRICRYTDLRETKTEEQPIPSVTTTRQREIFGAHTDSSFVTIVPVAAISGLEVFDEAAEQWLRPEQMARRYWEMEQEARGDDPMATIETISSLENDKDVTHLPWHARYVVMMPGEFLQIVSRNEIPAAVHRVVAAKGNARLSAPILLRGRPGTTLDVGRYLGTMNHPLLQQCDGMSMEQIHQAMQPTSFE